VLNWKQLVRQSDDALGKLDIAEVNWACTAGLPGADHVDHKEHLATLDAWTALVKETTEAELPKFRKRPQDYSLRHEEYFRCKCLIEVLKQKVGVGFDPSGFEYGLFPKTGAEFLFGLTATKCGTYTTMPVLWAAVGRRLGYPIKLVQARWRSGGPHLFARWDQVGKFAFNIEAVSVDLKSPHMDFYRNGTQFGAGADVEKDLCLFESMSPRMELAMFLVQRGQTWTELENFRRATEAFAWASAVHPRNVRYAQYLMSLIRGWHERLQTRKPPRWPAMVLDFPQRRFPDVLPREVEQDILLAEATENLLNDPNLEDRWWAALRSGRATECPARAVASLGAEGCQVRFDLHRPAAGYFDSRPAVEPLLRYPQWSPPPTPPAPPRFPAVTIPALPSAGPGKELHWRQLVRLPEHELAALDLAEMNLACIADFPDTENVDRQECRDILDFMTRDVAAYTREHEDWLQRWPEKFKNSRARFCALCLVSRLQRHHGVQYNPAKKPLEVPFDSADTFIHGVLLTRLGTCSNLPVLYAAVGRRLGYPIKLVSTLTEQAGHQFARWDDSSGECFNIEGTSEGLMIPPEEHYHDIMPKMVTPELSADAEYLQSRTPAMDLADFITARGHRWREMGRYREAIDSYVWGHVLRPTKELPFTRVTFAVKQWLAVLSPRIPKGFPPFQLHFDRRWPDPFGYEKETEILKLEAAEALLNDPACEEGWWGPMRGGERVALPLHFDARFKATGECRIEFVMLGGSAK
jgi:hypothetical protein